MIEFWLTFNNGEEKLRLPVPPKDFEMTTGLNNTVINSQELGEINLIGKPRLKTVTLSSYFPVRNDGLCQYADFPAPDLCIDMIARWRKSGKPIRLLIVGETLKVNEAMSIESFHVSQRHGPQDIYFTLELKEYRFVPQQQDGNGNMDAVALLAEYTGSRPVEEEIPPVYAVRPGDTLWGIAKRYYGDGSRAEELRKKNGLPDEPVPPPGKVLIL
ncbi:MAG: xkdP [Paenibacillaceae bacterium]|nr:xkdP [Paenibacillaceae bacterium]